MKVKGTDIRNIYQEWMLYPH
ncbi:hypothetical protein AGR13a_Lc70010 [Agrobacterium genomosp. 13 str. CFBP 6927]|uniref:Uncharacterized protein n=1 Tax=Agrobacterium genomosp. 13 str. CFBP 6927 TaxID=1183428 RepID=A0ABP2BQZ5_9HYPH|nr:hypothetical protein AGR13a_Lc70010 [Agrobacterium genomosp. 13 str. CFBP 6927]